MDWTRRLRIRQLEVLMDLVQTCNLSHTAERLCMTQPALSKWLTELESELGVPLFERHSRGLIPTRYGMAMAERARVVLAEVERTRETLEVMADGACGQLSIGVTATVSTGLLPESVALMAARWPDAQLLVTESTLEPLLAMLYERRVDMVLARLEDDAIDDRLRCVPLYDEHICIVAPPHHPLAHGRPLAWEELAGCAWIMPPRGNPMRRELDRELALAGLPPPRYRIEAIGLLTLIAIMRHANLLTALSRRVLHHFEETGQLVALDLPYRGRGNVGILRHRDALDTVLTRAFTGILHEVAGLAPPPASQLETSSRR